jgi:hypothetical protein
MFLSFTTGAASAAGTAYSCVLSFSEVRDAQSLALCSVWYVPHYMRMKSGAAEE